jgi:hypothetical protein
MKHESHHRQQRADAHGEQFSSSGIDAGDHHRYILRHLGLLD